MIDTSLIQLLAAILGPGGLFLAIKMIVDASKKSKAEQATPQDVRAAELPASLQFIEAQIQGFRDDLEKSNAKIEQLERDRTIDSQRIFTLRYGLQALNTWAHDIRDNWTEHRKKDFPPKLPEINLDD